MNKDAEVLVSVIIPTFNRREWIGECLDSVLNQTYKNFEVIVVDDGSTDGTVEWLAAQPKYDAIVVHRQGNSGASVARNNGIETAKGELIAFIDSDDALLPNHLEKAVEVFEKFPETGLFCCDSKMIDADGGLLFGGKTWHQNLAEYKNIQVKSGFRTLEDLFLFSNCFPGFTLRKEVFEKLGGFIQSIFPADDYDLALRVAGSHYKVYYLHEPLCLRREHDGQCSGIQNSVKTCRKLIEALEKVLVDNSDLQMEKAKIRQRFSEIELELGMSQVKEGNNIDGVKKMLQSVLRDPKQISRIARIGKKRLFSKAKSE